MSSNIIFNLALILSIALVPMSILSGDGVIALSFLNGSFSAVMWMASRGSNKIYISRAFLSIVAVNLIFGFIIAFSNEFYI